jgi:4-hydroxythreonine-4-phosphate dehydrogenase
MTPRLGITVGDPAGIGPEIVSAALGAGAHGGATVRVYGDVEAVARAGPLPPDVATRPISSAAVEPGAPTPEAARGIVEAIRSACRDYLAGELDAIVTAPISKEILARGGFGYPGHTELLQEEAGRGRAVMLLVGGSLRVALVTLHCALREVPDLVTEARVLETLDVVHVDLRRQFGIPTPRIAVCGLNPHAGEGGRFGREEIEAIAPGVQATGPFAADSLFHRAASGEFDAVLGMYHDQALGPLKLHAFGRAVNVTLGLPILRTSVDHGTAFDIAGRGVADCGSMVEAIRLAGEIVRNLQSERRGGRA